MRVRLGASRSPGGQQRAVSAWWCAPSAHHIGVRPYAFGHPSSGTRAGRRVDTQGQARPCRVSQTLAKTGHVRARARVRARTRAASVHGGRQVSLPGPLPRPAVDTSRPSRRGSCCAQAAVQRGSRLTGWLALSLYETPLRAQRSRRSGWVGDGAGSALATVSFCVTEEGSALAAVGFCVTESGRGEEMREQRQQASSWRPPLWSTPPCCL